MASNTYWQLDKEYYNIAQDADLIIRVIEHAKVEREETQGIIVRTVVESVPKKVHEFKVKREILSNASIYFKKLLGGGDFKESQQTTVDLHEDNAEGMVVWFKVLHGNDLKSTFSSTSIRGVWEVLAAAHKYGLDPKSTEVKTWFERWYAAYGKDKDGQARLDFKDWQMLLFPCHSCDYAEGFAAATKYLVYRATGHITERRPDGYTYDHLRLESQVIQQVNAAKGRLKTILHRNLYSPIEKLLRHADCDCKEKVLYAYEKALLNTGAWPIESVFLNQSVYDIIRKLQAFPETEKVRSKTCGRSYCAFDFKSVVLTAVSETRNYFDGLCLDCMDASKPKFGDADEDYWRHAGFGDKWDRICRIRHKQPTWYFSFMGRKQKMIEWQQKKKEERQDRYLYGW